MSVKYYTGIGARKTPKDILEKMKLVAAYLSKLGYTLRSGAADGADTAFETGCKAVRGDMEIYLPWHGFNERRGTQYTSCPSQAAFDMAAEFHPAWNTLSRGAKALHARNCHQILGQDLKTPSKFVLCWTTGTGGTMQALRIAKYHGIEILNLINQEHMDRINKFIQQMQTQK